MLKEFVCASAKYCLPVTSQHREMWQKTVSLSLKKSVGTFVLRTWKKMLERNLINVGVRKNLSNNRESTFSPNERFGNVNRLFYRHKRESYPIQFN